MGKKKACEDKDYVADDEAKYICKKCERLSDKEKKLFLQALQETIAEWYRI